MKHYVLFLLILLSSTVYSLDLYTYFNMDNFHFNDSNQISSTDFAYQYGEVVTNEINSELYLDFGFRKSKILDYSLFTDFRITNSVFGFNLGIFTNFLTGSSQLLTPGLNYGVDFILPGYFLLDLSLQNTIPNTSELESGVTISNYAIKGGFYVGDAIITANILSESKSVGTLLETTSLKNSKYYLNMDLFDKYTKYRISIDLGWNQISKLVTALSGVADGANVTISSGNTTELKAGSFYFSTLFTILATDFLNIDLGGTMNLIKFPLKNVSSFSADEFNWTANLGILYKL